MLVCISLVTNDAVVAYIFIFLLAICVYFEVLRLLPIKKIGLFILLLLSLELSLCILDTVVYQIGSLQIFSASPWPVFSFH